MLGNSDISLKESEGDKRSGIYGLALGEEEIVVNTLAMVLVATGITWMVALRSEAYQTLPEEVIIVNALAMVLVALGILVSYAVRREPLRVHSVSYVSERL